MTTYKISADPNQRGKLRGKASLDTGTLPAVKYSLAGLPAFGDLSVALRRQIETRCRWRDARAGERIMGRGETGRDVYILLSGKAHVLNFSHAGRVVDYAVLEAGDLFGEVSAIDGNPRGATVMTRTPCRLAVLDADLFLELMESAGEFNRLVVRRLAAQVRTGIDRIAELTLLGGRQRVCLELLRLARPDPAQLHLFVIYPAPNQALIASGVGVSRETVARMFGALARQNIIERKAKTLYIRDREKLERLAMSDDVIAGG
jgi:CRP-like cAMP-binding protein